MNKHPDSHLDHSLTEAQLHYLLGRFADRGGFFLETIELPDDLGTIPCGLWGPLMGDPPIAEIDVVRAHRGTRAWASRLVARAARPTRQVTVIAGPHDGHPCVLYTAFGGPAAPQEPGDVRRQLAALEAKRRALPDRSPESAEHAAIYAQILALREKRAVSDAFWRDHALAQQ